MKKNLYIGGYSILDLNGSNVYKQALICAEQNKPVLVYDDPERYYADTIKIDTDNDDNVIITKGGKTITINDANAVSSEGDIQKHLYEHRITINGDNTNDEEYYIRIFIYNNSKTQFTYEMLDNFKFNGVIVDSQYVTKAIEELSFNFADNQLVEIYSVYDNENINAYAFDLDDLTITDEVTQLF